jgi:hypothetical protein
MRFCLKLVTRKLVVLAHHWPFMPLSQLHWPYFFAKIQKKRAVRAFSSVFLGERR